MQETLMKTILKEICEWVYDNSGIELPKKYVTLDLYTNPRGSLSAEAKLTYFGPLKQKTNFPRIKMDLTAHEKVVLPPEKMDIFHNYSDKPLLSPKIVSYCYEEIFAEKLRALGERARPRDLYDVIHLYEKRKPAFDKSLFLQTLAAKCEFKNMPTITLSLIERHPQKTILSSEWDNMLRHQLSELKPFEYFWNKLSEVFEWLHTDKV
jgi:predicted nucleotidyltransferase component of viral defense system